MTYDTLTYNGSEKAFAAWGFSQFIVGTKRHGAADTFRATLVGPSVGTEVDAPTFPFEAFVIVRVNRASSTGATNSFSGGTIKFQGKCVKPPAHAAAASQAVSYEFEGPWYDLAQCDYMQLFYGGSGSFYLPETILNTSTAVSSGIIQISVGDQIQAILQWLLDQYAAQSMTAPFQYTGRALNSGAIDLNVGAGTGTRGGDYSFNGFHYTYHLPGSGLTIDSSLYSLFLPTFIEKPMKCDRSLLKCLELSPRVVIWFDYSTTPPTIRFDLVDNMTAKTLPVLTGSVVGAPSHKSLSIAPRYDLQPRAVIIKYRVTNTIGGVPEIDYVVDKWTVTGSNVNLNGAGNNITDPNCGLRVINEIVDLPGYNAAVFRGHLDVQPLACIGGSQSTKRAWWASSRGGEKHELSDYRVRFQSKGFGATPSIPDATIYYAGPGCYDGAGHDSAGASVTPDANGNYPFTAWDLGVFGYRIVRGSHHPWMVQPGGSAAILSCKAKVLASTAWAEYTTVGSNDADTASGVLVGYRDHVDMVVNMELTNCVGSGDVVFNQMGAVTPGEGYVVGNGGIAQYLYQHLSALQFDGDVVQVGASFVDSGSAQYVTLGNCLNLSGGATLWATMRAQIQEIHEDYARHATSIQIGVSKFLSAGQISSLLNMWRFRRPWYPTNARANVNAANQNYEFAKASGQVNTVTGLDILAKNSWTSADAINATATQVILVDATTGQIIITQQGAFTSTSATVMSHIAGTGAPGPSTLN